MDQTGNVDVVREWVCSPTSQYHYSSTPWMEMPFTYVPCPHQHFKSPNINREQLSHSDHIALLSTPKGYRWIGEANLEQSPGYTMMRPAKRKPRSERKAIVGTEQKYIHEFLSEVWNIMTPEMIERLKKLLIDEFGMSAVEAEEFIAQQGEMMESPKKTGCLVDLDIRSHWLKEFRRLLTCKITDYIVMMMCARRSQRTRIISSEILKHLCDITGEQCSLNKPCNRVQRIQVFVADRIAAWLSGVVAESDKDMCNELTGGAEGGDGPPPRRPSRPQKRPQPRPQRPKRPPKERPKPHVMGDKPGHPPSTESSKPVSKPPGEPTTASTTKPPTKGSIEPTSGDATKEPSKPTSTAPSKPTSGPGSKPASGPGSKPTSGPGSKPASGPGSKPASGPPSKPASGPPSKGPSKSPSQPASKPSSKPDSQPSSKPSSKPPSIPPSKPPSKSPSKPSSQSPSKPISAAGSKPVSGDGSKADVQETEEPPVEEPPEEEQAVETGGGGEGEPTEPEQEVTEPQQEVTEPQQEVTEPQQDVTEPQQEVTEPQQEVTEPQPEVTEPQQEVTEPQPEVTEPQQEVTEPEKEVTEGDEPTAIEEVKEDEGIDLGAVEVEDLVENEPEEPQRDPMEVVKGWIEETPKEPSPRQSAVSEIIEETIRKEMGDVTPEEDKAIIDVSGQTGAWVDKLVGEAEKHLEGVVVPPPMDKVAFHVKRGDSGCYYDVKKVGSKTTCEKTLAARAPRTSVTGVDVCKRPADAKPIQSPAELKEWAEWAAGVVTVAEQWVSWIDKTCGEAEKKANARQKGDETWERDWKKFKSNAQLRFIEWRRNKKYLKDTAKIWDEKITPLAKGK